MGNDMFNDEQLAHLKDRADEIERLRLALETAEANEEKLHEMNERLALDIVDAEDDRSDLAAMYESAVDRLTVAHEALDIDNAVCLCGCPLSDHEDVGPEDGEQCEHKDHECIRVAPAVLEIVGRVRLALEAATRERDLAEASFTEIREKCAEARNERDEARAARDKAYHATAVYKLRLDAVIASAPPSDAATEAIAAADAALGMIEYDRDSFLSLDASPPVSWPSKATVARARALLSALSTPAPAPSAKEGRT
jgi:hypothetical protein